MCCRRDPSPFLSWASAPSSLLSLLLSSSSFFSLFFQIFLVFWWASLCSLAARGSFLPLAYVHTHAPLADACLPLRPSVGASGAVCPSTQQSFSSFLPSFPFPFFFPLLLGKGRLTSLLPSWKGTAGFTSKYNSKIRGTLKDLELQADLEHETTNCA